ncbi:hydantoinase B/oxoprolinase family protein [uncultured Paludibaculum sp.]|uniref:hydantoinase B/oxoprolinase family protein n=1 Tax=uncultured Paludibaculum sp. TaxID=1765020 RepID=UPI002AAC0509|nr:hydantoinase B/oxoprolinase family protein [uncultured Paludibaculum sp.]
MNRPDPIELEFFRQLLVSIPEEMGVVLRKTAFSANIKERRDYSCAVYDAQARTIAMGDHMPVHLGAMPLSVEHVLRRFQLRPGDVAIVNDPFAGGTHLPDITAVAGVFPEKAKPAAFYVAARAHHSDVGGMSPGSMPLAREIYQEGLRLPPILLVREGVLDEGLMRLILANVRTPAEREGDLLAQWMSMERGAVRLTEAVTRYGLPRLNSNITALADYAERRMAAALHALPSGVYGFEDSLDEGVTIRARITLGGGRATVDFTGTDAQVAGPVNANYAITLSAVFYVFRCLLEGDVPANAGLLRPITVIAPPGTVVNANPPAAMAAGNVETSQRITDVLLGALSAAAPHLIPAASQGTMNNVSFGGDGFAWYETIAGGMGAADDCDGQSAVHTHMTNSWNTPVEAFEHSHPVRVRAYHVRRGSGGAGRHCGGDGIVRELEFLAPADVTILADRRVHPPYGLQGGRPGALGRTILHRGGKARLLPGKIRVDVQPGDRLRIETPGGGGFGLE